MNVLPHPMEDIASIRLGTLLADVSLRCCFSLFFGMFLMLVILIHMLKPPMMLTHQDLVHLLAAAFDAGEGHLLRVLSALLSVVHALVVLVLSVEDGVGLDGIEGFENLLQLLVLLGCGDGVGGWIYEDGVDEVGKNIFLSICIGVRLEG